MGPEVVVEYQAEMLPSESIRLEDLLVPILLDHRTSGTVTCILTDDEHLRQLNAAYRDKDATTDVLSFDLTDAVHPESTVLGDVYISIDRARHQARQANWPVANEISKLAIHGVLHLLGYDHNTDAEHGEMRAREDRYLASAGVITEKGV